ncbi:MAG TPA: hypothetical protein PKO06_24075, partial [Candidatus Ozemobacteraceae bacterium]|nr:hypothetical protein [Candidatus Ozemobacteraceae bacterium]
MKRIVFVSILLLALAVTVQAQSNPYADQEITGTQGKSDRIAAVPSSTAVATTDTAATALPKTVLDKLVLPIQENGKVRLLKGAAAWAYLQQKNPKLAQALQKLCNSVSSRPDLNAKLTDLLQRVTSLQITDGTIVLSLPGSRFLVIDRDGLDRVLPFSYAALDADEKRILDNSRIPEMIGPEGQPLQGRALFEELARRNPKALLAFTNLCARLRTPEYTVTTPEGSKSALSMIQGLFYQERDRFRAFCDQRLMQLIASNRQFSKAPGHGDHFPTSFKQ